MTRRGEHLPLALITYGQILDETEQILDAAQAASFESEFFKAGEARATYLLGSGEYVFIDPSVRPAFKAFREISTADKETRTAFIKAPNAVLASRIPSNVTEPEAYVGHAFIETAQFSDRVLGINKWEAPDLPWLADEANEWGTDLIVFEQPGNASSVVLPKQALQDAVEALQEGIAAGGSSVNVGGVEIPVSSGLLAAMQQMLPVSPDPAPSPDPELDSNPEPKLDGPFVVETIDGFEAVNYVKALQPPDHHMHYAPPRALMPSTSLMKHQEAGLKWLISAFNVGLPGVLIADDMGLGKTLQALVFMALYQEQVPEFKRRPCLIVAPTGLLNNWLREINQHLGNIGLGEVTQAYGSKLADLKADVKGRDTDFGVPMLNIQRLSNSNVVLTTYESLRDYQISFAQVSFGIVVFDEIQKTKNPRSLLSRAAAAVNGTFQIGLSGTPVENSLADLWTILDVLAPGLIRFSLKDFMDTYAGPTDEPKTLEKLKKLQQELLEPLEGRVHPVLRRLKSGVFGDGDMPNKIVHPALTTSMVMPPEQAEAYDAQLEAVQRGQIKTIQALQAFKRISLAPRPYDHWLDDPVGFIAASGRLGEFFKILDAVQARNEKVLIFVESRELQPVLAQVLKERYGLAKLPLIINGSVSGESRQKSVNEFQEELAGFNVMLISPKAGGVGLTLTAANNIVHLERWWNPAVEDQCNDRAYRIGQKRDVNVYTPVARHPISEVPSFDLVLDGILSRKRGLAESLFLPSELSPEDFTEMFEGVSTAGRKRAFSPMSILESYDLETGEGFEDYVADAFHDSDFSVSKTKKSWDGGCDLIAKSGEVVVLCQVKQVRSDKALMEGVEEVIKAKSRYQSQNPTHLVLVTNAKELASSQVRMADGSDVILILGDSIAHYGQALRAKTS
jgi:superfamily II DNA or RNA helicase/Holliday junction resolvase-like predicted endonuclease